jgi:hypothetical protein
MRAVKNSDNTVQPSRDAASLALADLASQSTD